MTMENPMSNDLNEDMQEVKNLKVPAMQLLMGSLEIKRETQLAVSDILAKVHLNVRNLLIDLSDYLRKKNPKIFEADNLTKQGHDLYKSESIKALGLSEEDTALLAWYQQVRA